MIVAACGAFGVAALAQHDLVKDRDLAPGVALWAAAAVLFLFAVWRAHGLVASGAVARVAAGENAIPRVAEIVLFAAVIGVGIFFRLYKIGSIPPGLNHDAAWEGLYAIKITQGIPYAPYVNAAWGRETMFFYIVAGWQELMGPSKLALQMGSISVGIATCAAMYFFMRRLIDTRTALVATVLLGISGWHLTLSKVGWREILVPLFIPLIFYFLVRAVDGRKWRDFAIAGLLLGASLDTYDAARVLPFTASLFLLSEIIRNRSLLTKNYLYLALFVVCAAIAFSPLGWYAYNNWEAYTGRGRYLWIGQQIKDAGSLHPIWVNTKAALLLFNYRGNGDDFFVREPLLDVPLSIFFPLGLIISLLRVRQRAYFLLVAMLVLDLVVGVASRPNGNRNLGSVIPVMAISAVFLVEAWRWMSAAFPAYQARFSLVLVAVLLYAAWGSYDRYLGPDHYAQWGFYPETQRVGLYMHDIPDGSDIYAAAGNWPRDAMTYLSYRGHGDPMKPRYDYHNDPQELLGVPVQKDHNTVFIVESAGTGATVMARLEKRYPQAKVDSLYYPKDKMFAQAITIPAGMEQAKDSGPAYVPPGGLERDATRRDDLLKIAGALLAYRDEHGSFPFTNGNAQTGCAYKGLDQLCQFEGQLGAGTLVDPRKDAGRYGYWYGSDGKSFTLYATMEGPVKEEDTCAPGGELGRKPNLLCLTVKP